MIEQSPSRLGKVRFGVFETDLRAGELRKCGIRIKLQTQPFKLLGILLSHAGEIVTREELQQQIWGSETVVNFDHSLGTAVNKVREALGDSAENPRYIETLAKRGYRFVAPVEILDYPDSLASAKASVNTPPVPVAEIPAPPPASAPLGRVAFASRMALPAAVGVLAVAAGFGVGLRQSSVLVKPVLLPFTQITSSDSIYPGEVGVERFPTLLTDGSRLYFSKIENGRVALAYSPISGGDAHPLTTPSEIGPPRLADISPDGAKLLIFGETLGQLERTMWIVPSVGGSARKIVSGLGHDGAWMPGWKNAFFLRRDATS